LPSIGYVPKPTRGAGRRPTGRTTRSRATQQHASQTARWALDGQPDTAAWPQAVALDGNGNGATPTDAAGNSPVDQTHLLTLERVITGTAQAGDVATTVAETLAALTALPGVDAVTYHEVDRVAGTATLRAGRELPDAVRPQFRTLEIATAPFNNALVQRQPVFVEDASLLSGSDEALAPFEAVAMAPVVASDDVIGAVSLLALRPREWTHEDQLVLPAVGRELGGALERLAAGAALRDRRLPLHDLFDSVDEFLVVAAGDGRMLWANAALQQRLGLSDADWAHMTMLDFHPPGRRIEAAAALADLLERGGGISRVPLLARDGTHVDVETRVRWGTWDGRRVLYIMSREAAGPAPGRDDALLEATLDTVTAIAYVHDPATAEHSRRVTQVAASIANKLGLPRERVAGLRLAAGLHDVGKTAIPADVLLRPGKLSGPELALVRAHPEAGCEMVRETESPWPLAEIILQHHERLDGSGYPRGLHGGEILTEARILAVADVFEAMSASRPYRTAFSIDQALTELRLGSGHRYDPDVVAACVAIGENGGFPAG
jgi:putative nucleotidyltransferase with HDIG domain